MKQVTKLADACREFKKEAIEILGIEQSVYEHEEHHGIVDVAVITATADEFESVKKIVGSPKQTIFNKNDSTIYFIEEIETKSNKLKVLLPFPYAMGIEAASTLTTKVISSFRPKHIFMCGICAGNKNICKVGDVIIAEKSLNYNSIVEIQKSDESQDKKFMHHVSAINGILKNQLELFTTTTEAKSVKDEYQNKSKINHDLKHHMGLLVTGSSLIRSDQIITEINSTYHGVKGLDMETYGVYYASTQVFKDYAPNFVSIKSVSDFGDNTKHDLSAAERKKYALFTSSSTLVTFLKSWNKSSQQTLSSIS